MKRFVIVLALCAFVSVALGYLDVALSDLFLYQNQVAAVHYVQTIERHFLLGLAAGLFCAFFLKRLAIATILRLWIFLLLFFILGVKIQLVWLNSTFFAPDSLAATAGLGVLLALLYWLSAKALPVVPGVVLAAAAFAMLVFQVPRHLTATATGPNIVLIVLDTVRADHVGCYGYMLKTTPHIDELASKGVLFEQAITPSPWTAPSHASIFTGLFPGQNQVHEKNISLDPQIPTLASLLSQKGYQTVGLTNNVYVRRRLGLAHGFQDYEELWGRNEISSLLLVEEWLNQRTHPRVDAGAQDTFGRVQDWFHYDHRAGKPFFLFINYMEAHAPYTPPAEYKRKFVLPDEMAAADRVNQDPEAFLVGQVHMNDRDFALLSQLYDGEINYLDDQIGRVLTLIAEYSTPKDTMIIVLSDHGENLGDHGLMSHEMSVHDTLIHVPMILYYPPLFSGGRRDVRQIQTIDLFPTVLRVAGVKLPGVVPGIDLSEGHEHRFSFAEYNTVRAVERVKRRFPEVRDPFATVVRDLVTVRTKEYKLDVDGITRRYFLLPEEDEPLAEPDVPPVVRSELDRALETWTRQMGGQRKESKERMTPEEYEELKALNYIN
jgi:arylsulfatase A-like enzyme